MPRPSARVLLAGLCALMPAACSSAPHARAATPPAVRTLAAARDLQYADTLEIRFGADLVGYVVEVLPVPEGLLDERPWTPGTLLIQGPQLDFLGFITPGGTTYRFDAQGGAHAIGFGSRDQGIAAFFGRNGTPRLVTTQPGLPRG